MKRLIPYLILVAVCASVSQGAFDYTISDTYDGGSIVLNSKSLLITGSGALSIMAKGSSYVEVQNTAPLEIDSGGIYTLGLDDTSELNFSGGAMGGFHIYEDATATFSGGSINYISSYQYSNAQKHITFVCDVDSVTLTGNVLTGNWLNGGGSFSITLVNQPNYNSVYSNINFIPEPTTLSLLGLGGLMLRKRKK